MRHLVGDRSHGGCLGDRLRKAIDRSPQMASPVHTTTPHQQNLQTTTQT